MTIRTEAQTIGARIILISISATGDTRYLAGAYLGRASSGYSHLHEHTCGEEKNAIQFCTKEAAQELANTMNAHKNHVWNVVIVSGGRS